MTLSQTISELYIQLRPQPWFYAIGVTNESETDPTTVLIVYTKSKSPKAAKSLTEFGGYKVITKHMGAIRALPAKPKKDSK